MPKRNRGSRPHPPIGKRANRGGESVFVATCAACGKRGYTSKQEVKRGAARIYPGRTMHFYQCGTLWHMTSADSGVMAEHRERQDVQEEP